MKQVRDEKCLENFGLKPERKRALRSERKWEDNIKIDLREIG